MEKLNESNLLKLNHLIPLLEEIVMIGKIAIRKFPTDAYELSLFTFINYLERFVVSIDNINILLLQYKGKPSVENAIGLIIRASLLDYMTICYLSTYQVDIFSDSDVAGQEKFQQQLDGIISDHINNTFKYLKLTRDTGLISQADYKLAIENCWITYSFVFNDSNVDYVNPEKKLANRDYKSPKDLFKRIHNHKLTNKYSRVYDLYTYYSKYEHWGLMTHFMQRQGLNKDFERILDSMYYMIHGISLCFIFLQRPSEKLFDERKALQNIEKEYNKLMTI